MTHFVLVLFGRHGYGLTPEEETAVAWDCLLLGLLGGVALGLAVAS